MRSCVTASPKFTRADLSSCSTEIASFGSTAPRVRGGRESPADSALDAGDKDGDADEGGDGGARQRKKQERCSKVSLTSSRACEALKMGRWRRSNSKAS